jgi:ribonuclease HII
MTDHTKKKRKSPEGDKQIKDAKKKSNSNRKKNFSTTKKIVKEGSPKKTKNTDLDRQFELDWLKTVNDLSDVKINNYHPIGVDEVGLGPIAGVVTACACYIPLSKTFEGVRDSKKLSHKKIQEVYERLTTSADVMYSVVSKDPQLIDEINIRQAKLRAMKEAIENLLTQMNKKGILNKKGCPIVVFIDGKDSVQVDNQTDVKGIFPVIRGDSKIFVVGAASIMAKHTRDMHMKEMHKQYPQYGFNKNVGYPTPKHLQALNEYGPCPIHRKKFKPVALAIETNKTKKIKNIT